MNEFICVVPYDEGLFGLLKGRKLVVRTSDVRDIPRITKLVQENELHCIDLITDEELSEIDFEDGWGRFPLAVTVNSPGNITKLLYNIERLRECNLKIYFQPDRSFNYTAVQIIASLGITAGIRITPDKPADWDAANDLLHYAAYSQGSHAPVEPFDYVLTRYAPQEFTYMTTPFFENPLKYLHLNEKIETALSERDIREGRFVAVGHEELKGIATSDAYTEALNAWQRLFLENSACSFCPAWRVCQGIHRHACEHEPGCSRFFQDLNEAADHHYARREETKVWQS